MGISGISRRSICSVAIGGIVALPRCTASDDPDIALEYSVSIGSEPDVIPEDVHHHYGQDGNEWVVVEIAVDEGELDMEDVWFNSRIETEDRYHDLDHASGEIPEGVQSRGAVQEGGEAVAVYQIPAGAEVVGWDLSEMDQKIEAEER